VEFLSRAGGADAHIAAGDLQLIRGVIEGEEGPGRLPDGAGVGEDEVAGEGAPGQEETAQRLARRTGG